MSDDKNFQAYPAKIIDWQESGIQQRTVYEDQEQGLTARDVFAKDAPDVPDWFEKMNEIKQPEIWVVWATKEISRKYNNEEEEWIEAPTQEEKNAVMDWGMSWTLYFAEKRMFPEKIFFEWRWYYADTMLKTR